MRQSFRPNHPIVVWATLHGPVATRTAKLLLDTGAAITMIRTERLRHIGAEVDIHQTMLITSASDVQAIPTTVVPMLRVNEHRKENFRVLAHDLPGVANVDGLLGMDFLSNLHLSIRMRKGILTLEEDSDGL